MTTSAEALALADALDSITAPGAVSRAIRDLAAANTEMLSLLVELVDMEGPQPGTGGWADKVHRIIDQPQTSGRRS